MKAKALITNLVMLVLLSNPNTLVSQTVSGTKEEWEVVKALVAGDKVTVRLKDGKKVEGTVSGVSDTQLTLTRGTAARDLNRASISKVYRIVSRSAGRSIGKSTAMGAGIGFGIGAGVGIAGGTYEDLETAGLVGLLGGLGAAIGAGIGAVVGAVYVKPGRVLIYEAK